MIILYFIYSRSVCFFHSTFRHTLKARKFLNRPSRATCLCSSLTNTSQSSNKRQSTSCTKLPEESQIRDTLNSANRISIACHQHNGSQNTSTLSRQKQRVFFQFSHSSWCHNPIRDIIQVDVSCGILSMKGIVF
jgi:hypothetical protein